VKAEILWGDHTVRPQPLPGGKRLFVSTTVVTLGHIGESVAVHSEVIKAGPKGGKGPNGLRGYDSGAHQVPEGRIGVKPRANGGCRQMVQNVMGKPNGRGRNRGRATWHRRTTVTGNVLTLITRIESTSGGRTTSSEEIVKFGVLEEQTKPVTGEKL